MKTFGASYAKAIQAVVKKDDEQLQIQIELLQKYTSRKTGEKYYAGCINGFKGILQNDKLIVEKGINELLTTHPKKDNLAAVKDLFSLEGAAIAKLAYRRGVEINLDILLIP